MAVGFEGVLPSAPSTGDAGAAGGAAIAATPGTSEPCGGGIDGCAGRSCAHKGHTSQSAATAVIVICFIFCRCMERRYAKRLKGRVIPRRCCSRSSQSQTDPFVRCSVRRGWDRRGEEKHVKRRQLRHNALLYPVPHILAAGSERSVARVFQSQIARSRRRRKCESSLRRVPSNASALMVHCKARRATGAVSSTNSDVRPASRDNPYMIHH